MRRRTRPVAVVRLACALVMVGLLASLAGCSSADHIGSSGMATIPAFYCGRCGIQNADGSTYCAQCGGLLLQEQFCSQCGREYAAGARFCPGCGNALSSPSYPVPPPVPPADPYEPLPPSYERSHSVGHQLLWYIPNRVLDAFDPIRARARFGPGVAVGVRATDVADLYLGAYASIYVGLPGPRMYPTLKLPFGLESYTGVEISLAEGTLEGSIGPDYSPTEFGVSLQAFIVGLDVGIDPIEIVDLFAGIIFLDPRGDDF